MRRFFIEEAIKTDNLPELEKELDEALSRANERAVEEVHAEVELASILELPDKLIVITVYDPMHWS